MRDAAFHDSAPLALEIRDEQGHPVGLGPPPTPPESRTPVRIEPGASLRFSLSVTLFGVAAGQRLAVVDRDPQVHSLPFTFTVP
jgi:hypothetical protein